MNARQPCVFIVVLQHNGYRDTLECLRSLSRLTYENRRIVLVDNASTDGSVALVRSQFAQVEFLCTGANKGFAGGSNCGIRYALEQGADYVLLVNNDTEIEPQALTWLVQAADEEQSAGLVGGKVYYHDSPDVIWLLYTEWDWLRGRPRQRGHDVKDLGQFTERRHVDYITGTMLLAGRKAIERIGLLDESYFLYFEDVDWGLRARMSGYHCVVEPRAVLWHKVSATARGSDEKPGTYRHYYYPRNNIVLMRRHAPWWAKITFVPFFAGRVIETILRVLGSRLVYRRRRAGARLLSILLGCWDGIRGRTGYRQLGED